MKTKAILIIFFFLFLICNGPAPAASPCRIESFSPQGTVKTIRQVSVRFSKPMIPFGDPNRLMEPFTIQCPAAGKSRWADDRNWVYDFHADLPAGLSCRFTLKPEVKSLAGEAMEGQTHFDFSTGGPAIIRIEPYESSLIDEEQIFILTLDTQPDRKSILENATFFVEGIASAVGVRLIEGKIRENILESRGYLRKKETPAVKPDPPIILLQSKQRFPNSAGIRLVWGKGIKSQTGIATVQEQIYNFKTRPEFSAGFTCSRENPQADCIPLLPMTVHFTASVSRKQAQKIVLKLMETPISSEQAKPSKNLPPHSGKKIWKASLDKDENDVDSIVFNGPFPEKTVFSVELPPDLKDEAGRKLVNAKQYPLTVRTGEYPPLAKFSGRFGILESGEGALLPVTVRNLESSLNLFLLGMQAKEGKNQTGQITGKIAGISSERGAGIQTWLRKIATVSRTKSLFTTGTPTKRFSLPKANGAKAFEVLGIPLDGPGFYLLELESRVLGRSLLNENKPMYVQTAALVTNLAAHFKKGRESSLVWVTTLDKAKPVPGATVTIRNCQDKILWKGKTDASGIALISQKLPADSELPYCSFKEDEDHSYRYDESFQLAGLQGGMFVTAQDGDDMTFVHSSWDQGIEPWRFQILEESSQAPVIAHTIFDRTLLRAGDTVHMKHILRQHGPSGFRFVPKSKWPAKAEIIHTGSGQKYEFALKWDHKGIAESSWSIPKEARLGRYDIYLHDHPSGGFRVEEFRIPLMRGVIQSAASPLIQAREATLDLGVTYLAGGGAAHLPVKLRSEVRPRAITSFEGYEDFLFANGEIREGIKRRGEYTEDEENDPLQTVKLPLQNLVLEKTGSLSTVIRSLPQSDIPRDLATEMEFMDPNGEISTVAARIPLWPSQYLIGIKPDSWASSKENLKFQVAVVDISGAPAPGVKVHVNFLERKYYSHRKRLVGGFYAYEHTTETKNAGSICEGQTGPNGLLSCEAKSPISGNGILQASCEDGQGRRTVANRDIWVAEKEDWWFDVGDSDRMDILGEKKRYEPGETAVFQVRMPFREATALISVEREGILDAWVTNVSGKNPVIEVPVKNTYAPNAYVSALVVRGRAAQIKPTSMVDLGKPAYKLGIAEMLTGWKHHELKLTVSTDAKVYKVREKVKIKIQAKTADGQTLPAGAEIAVAAVDEGLLELMPNRSWDLLLAMMGKRGSSVKTSTAQTQVVGKRHFGLKALPQGGGGGLSAGHAPTRNLFDPLLLWMGRVQLDAQGEATIEAKLNDSLTSFRIVAVATAGAGFFGTGSTSVRSTQDLMILSGLPPLVREGDTFFAPFTVRNSTSGAMDLQMTADVPGLSVKPKPFNLSLAPGEAKETGWTIIAPEGRESLLWTVSVKNMQNGLTDRIKITQKVSPVTPVRTYMATITQLDKPFSLTVESPPEALPGRGGVKTSLKSKLSDGLDGVRDYMKNYSYTCMEQQISRSVALRDEKLWKDNMSKLPAHLDATGLVRFFPLHFLCGCPTLTSYILAIADEAGWSIPEDTKEKMQNGLIHFIEGKNTCQSSFSTADSSLRKLSAIEALSRYGKASASMLGSIQMDPNLWPTSAVIDWRNILRNVRDIPDTATRIKEAEQILRSRINFQGTTMGFSSQKFDGLWWLMTSVDTNAVRALLTLRNETSWKEDMPRLALGALARQKRGHWDLTTANAWGLLAMEKFSKTFESFPVTGQTLSTVQQQSKTLNWKDHPKGKSELFAWPRQPSLMRVSHAGGGKPWLTVSSLAAIPIKKPFSSGYQITKTLIPVSQKKPKCWTKGDIVRVRLDLEAQSDQTWVVVQDPVPAGSTILGGGLGRDSRMLTDGEKKEGDVWPAFEERSFEAFRAYYEYVPKGKWRAEYTIRLNGQGIFRLPATRVEAMYFPEMLGEIPNKTMKVEP